jgi:hypothetical protein
VTGMIQSGDVYQGDGTECGIECRVGVGGQNDMAMTLLYSSSMNALSLAITT